MVVILAIDIGIRNLSICEIMYTDSKYQIRRWKLYDLVHQFPHIKSVQKITANDYHLLVEFFFNDIYSRSRLKTTINHVVIETQPAGRHLNMKMHLLSHYLYDNIVKLRNSSTYGHQLYSVNFVSGHCKYYKPWLIKFGEAKQSNYVKRKQLSVRLCAKWCQIYGLTQLWKSFQHTKKQDDLADSFLLGLYFVQLNYGVLNPS